MRAGVNIHEDDCSKGKGPHERPVIFTRVRRRNGSEGEIGAHLNFLSPAGSVSLPAEGRETERERERARERENALGAILPYRNRIRKPDVSDVSGKVSGVVKTVFC